MRSRFAAHCVSLTWKGCITDVAVTTASATFRGRMDSIRLFSENMQSAFVRQIRLRVTPADWEAAPTVGDGQHARTVDSITCDLASLQQRIAALHSDCCTGDGVTCDASGKPSVCTPRCAPTSSRKTPTPSRLGATNVFVRPFSKLHYCCSFHDACRSELEAIDVSVGETFDDMARSCHGAKVTAPSVPPGCSYAAFFPIMLDCSDESNANDDDPHTHGPPFCESSAESGCSSSRRTVALRCRMTAAS